MQTQQRTTPAPFFLPLQQQSTTSSYFSPSSSPSTVKQQRRSQPVQQRVQTSTNSYFKTNETSYSNKQKESESELHSSSRLTALHSSLQQEAEKIRKWKNVTELELKHKEKCLEEANCTIEKQRKNVTELQLKNESLQSKLKNEIANQRELQRKIASTREMCTALKNHSIKIDESIMKGQTDRDHLMLLNQERLLNYQELMKKYQALEKGQLEWHDKCEQTLAMETRKLTEAENHLQDTLQTLYEAESKIVLLEEQSAGDKLSIQSLRDEVTAKSLQYDSIKMEKGELECKLSKKQESLTVSEKAVLALTQELKVSKQQVCQYAEKWKNSQTELEKNQKDYSEKMSQLEAVLASEREKLKQLLAVKDNLESRLTQTSSELNSKCQALDKDLEEKTTELYHSQKTCQGLEVEVSEAKKTCNELEACKSQLRLSVRKLEEELVAVREELSQQVAEKEEKMEKAESLIANAISRQESVREYWKKKELELETKLEEAQKEKKGVTNELHTLSRQLEEAKTSLESQMSVNSDQKLKYEECIGELRAERCALEETNGTLKQEIQDLSMNKENLTAQCSGMDQLAAEHKSLKACFDEKRTECEALQTKIVQIESEASAESERLGGAMEALKHEVSAVIVKQEESNKSHEMEVAELKAAMSVRANELTSLLEQSRKETSKVKTELDREKKDSTRKVQDLVAALDTYRSEHEIAMAGKDKLLQSVTDQLQQSEKMKELSDAKLTVYEGEINRLHSEISSKNEELKQLLESVKAVYSNSSTPVPHTPLKVSQERATLQQNKSSPVLGSLCENEVSSTPIPSSSSSCKPAAKPRQQPLPSATPLSHPPKPSIPSVPMRMYSYAQTPQQYRSKFTTPKYSARQKRGRSAKGEESGRTKNRENISYAQEDDEAVFKKPKTKDMNITTIEKASSTTKSTPRGKKQSKGSKATPKGKKTPSTDLSWFDLDSVYGFGADD